MNTELKLQALLDGELDAREAREVETMLAADQHATALLQELKWTKSAMLAADPALTLPESHDFFWAKIQRGIETEERLQASQVPVSSVPWWTKLLFPATGLAAMVGVLVVLSGSRPAVTDDALSESVSEDINAYSFHSEAEKMSVVYVSDENADFSPVDQDLKNETQAEK